MTFGNKRRIWRWLREVKPTAALALPIMAGMLSQMLLGLADSIMVGRLGVVPLAACAFVNAIAHLPLVFSIGLLSAVSVKAANAAGARQPAEAGEVLRHGLVLALVAGVGTILSLWASLPFLHLLGQPPRVIEASRVYLLLYAGSILPALVAHAAKGFSEAMNRAWIPNGILLGGVVLNIFLNWLWIYGNWGAPKLGLEGAGWATLVARGFMALAMVGFVAGYEPLRRFQPQRWLAKLHWPRFRGLWTIGWPAAMQHLMEVGAFVLAALMMGWIGADALAAHQIAITCAATTFMLILGLALAVCIRVGQAHGAGHLPRMRRIGVVGLVLAVSLMSAFAAVFVTWGGTIASWFIPNPQVIALTASLLVVAAMFQIADGVQAVSLNALRGMSDVKIPALIAVLAYWLVAIPAGFVLGFELRLGARGIWIGLALGLGTAALGLVWRFLLKSRTTPRNAEAIPGSAVRPS